MCRGDVITAGWTGSDRAVSPVMNRFRCVVMWFLLFLDGITRRVVKSLFVLMMLMTWWNVCVCMWACVSPEASLNNRLCPSGRRTDTKQASLCASFLSLSLSLSLCLCCLYHCGSLVDLILLFKCLRLLFTDQTSQCWSFFYFSQLDPWPSNVLSVSPCLLGVLRAYSPALGGQWH